jgi:hypothetical protein
MKEVSDEFYEAALELSGVEFRMRDYNMVVWEGSDSEEVRHWLMIAYHASEVIRKEYLGRLESK